MGPPLGPLLANKFMVELETSVIKTLVRRAHINCSTVKHLKHLTHIRKTFIETNYYLHWEITKVFKEIKEMTPSKKEIQVKQDENTSIKNHLLVLRY